MDALTYLPSIGHLLTLLHEVAAFALFIVQFSRATKTSRSTRPAILLTFWFLTACSIFAIFCPLVLPGWRPSLETIALLFAIAAVQWVTAKYWCDGVPREYCCEPSPHAGKVG